MLPIEKKFKRAIFSASNGCCVYCGAPATTIDHVVPQSKGGGDNIRNLVPACKTCNSTKCTKDLTEFIAYRVQKRIYAKIMDVIQQEIQEEISIAVETIQRLHNHEECLFYATQEDDDLYEAWHADE